MSGLFGMPQAPPVPPAPPAPSLNDPAIANRASEEMRQRQQGGRASQFMTNPQEQSAVGTTRRRELGAA